jgi:hypothetical protein
VLTSCNAKRNTVLKSSADHLLVIFIIAPLVRVNACDEIWFRVGMFSPWVCGAELRQQHKKSRVAENRIDISATRLSAGDPRLSAPPSRMV